jgi:hypothetical protein
MNLLTNTTMNMKELSMTTKKTLRARHPLVRMGTHKRKKMTSRPAIGYRADTYNMISQRVS